MNDANVSNTPVNAFSVPTLRKDLYAVYNGLRNGTIKPQEVHESNITAGRVLSAVRTELMYDKMVGRAPNADNFTE